MYRLNLKHLIIVLGLLLGIMPAGKAQGALGIPFLGEQSIGPEAWFSSLRMDEPLNNPPVAEGDTYSTNEDEVLAVEASGVLSNDSDPDGDLLRAVKVSDPTHGVLTLNADGSFKYIPALDFNGTDSFTYQANDGQVDSNIATVSITITPVNDPPMANSQAVTTEEDTSVAITLTASDVDGDTLTYAIVSGPVHGTLSGILPNLTYIPNPNYNGLDSFTFRVNDGQVDSNIATVSITIIAVNDPPLAVNDTYTVNEDAVLTVSAPGVLGNDQDPDGDALSAQLVSGVGHGTLIFNNNGGFTYTPAANYFGSDSFTYRAYDGQVYSGVAEVVITVNNLNDPPNALDDSYIVAEDVLLNIPAPGVLSNDTDPEGEALSANKVKGPNHGGLTLNSNGGFAYMPDLNYYGVDSFTYVASDGQVDSNIATVSITITAVNDPPVANSQAVTTEEDMSVAITLTASDVDGDTLTYAIVSGPAHGLLSGTLPYLTYTPALNYHGTDFFTFKVNDGQVDSVIATVSITITPVNDPPVANSDSGYRAGITGLTVKAPGVLSNDSDPDGDLLRAVKASDPTHGALTLNADGSFTYTPDPNFNGTDSFEYRANDGQADSNNNATVSIEVDTVRPNPPDWIIPVGNEGEYIMRESAVTLGVTVTGTDIARVRFRWFDDDEGQYQSIGEVTQSPYTISLSYATLPSNRVIQVFADTQDNFGNSSLNPANYTQTVRRIFIFPTALRYQIFLPLVFR